MEEKPKDDEVSEKPDEPEKPMEPLAAIAHGLSGIRTALGAIALIMAFNQCQSSLPGDDKRADALSGIDYSLRQIHAELKAEREATASVVIQLREVNKNLSDINGTVWNKSCSR